MKGKRLRLKLKLGLGVVGLAALLIAASQVFADFLPSEWRYARFITLPSDLGDESLIELFPDAEVFANSSPGLADLRIIAADGTEVPYKFDISRDDRQRNSFSVILSDKGYMAGQHTTFIADLGFEGVLHNEIEIMTTSSNFRRTAIVEASDDGETWTRIAVQQVFDFTVKEIRLVSRDTHVKYTDSTARYLRVRIADEGEGPLEISGATVFFVKETRARESGWPVSILSTTRDIERRSTLLELDLGAPGIPSHRLAVKIPDVNFHREVNLETSLDLEEWRTLVSQTAIYSYDTTKFVGDSMMVKYPETTSRYFRLVVFDEDNPPLNIQGVEMWGLQRRLVFSASPDESYKLYYGNADARRPSYDIERVFPHLATEVLPQAALGIHAANPNFAEKVPPVSERLSWLFPMTVSVAAVVVGLFLFGVLRQARKVLPPTAE